MNKFAFSLLALLCAIPLRADIAVAITIDAAKPGYKIADDYAGLSYETKREMTDKEGKYYFTPTNAPLIKMFQTLGIKNLRIGGNTVDSSKVSIPVQADIDQLFQFAQAADTKVIYSFRLNKGNPKGAAEQAKYIADKYAANLLCFSIGNEPDIYVHGYQNYLKIYRPIYDAINQAVPDAKFLGPSLTSNGVSWAHDFAKDFFPSGKFLYITQHQYAGGPGGKITDPEYGRGLILSPAWHDIYQKYDDLFGKPLLAAGDPFRLEEGNNFYNGGAKDVSDTYAAAMWGLDYLYWWAEHGSQGINFHNGDEVAAGQELRPCRYASFTSVPDGYFARPLAYTIKIFNLGSRGQIIPTTLTTDLNFVVYTVLGADKAVYLTLINKEHGATGRDADVALPTGYAKMQTIALTAPNNDAAAQDGLTLGGAGIQHDGTWSGKWSEVAAKPEHLKVPASSIVLVKLMN